MSDEIKDSLNSNRMQRLQEERDILEALVREMDDPSMSKDISENSARDTLLEKIKSQEQIVLKLEQSQDIVHIPGTWNIGDKLFVKYLRIVAYGKDKKVPKGRVKIELVDVFDVTTLKEGATIDDLDVVPTAINCPLGEALLHKAHNTVRYNTPVGYCEVEVERCLF